MKQIVAAMLLFALGLPSASAATFNLVATGDSITGGYTTNNFRGVFQSHGLASQVKALRVSSSGANSYTYTGQVVDPNAHPEARAHNFAHEAVNGPAFQMSGSQWIDDPDPDAIIVMLGTNDAALALNRPDRYIGGYFSNMTSVFDYYSTAETSSGKKPKIFVSTILPNLNSPGANAIIDELFNPWLRDQATAYGFTLIDTNAAIQAVPNWQSLYSSDGIHLIGNIGSLWLAQHMVRSVLSAYPGDSNLDGIVDGADYVNWANNFTKSTGRWADGDFNQDGVVDGADYVIWANAYNGGANTSQRILLAPEPSSLVLAVFGLAALTAGARWGRRC